MNWMIFQTEFNVSIESEKISVSRFLVTFRFSTRKMKTFKTILKKKLNTIHFRGKSSSYQKFDIFRKWGNYKGS